MVVLFVGRLRWKVEARSVSAVIETHVMVREVGILEYSHSEYSHGA